MCILSFYIYSSDKNNEKKRINSLQSTLFIYSCNYPDLFQLLELNSGMKNLYG